MSIMAYAPEYVTDVERDSMPDGEPVQITGPRIAQRSLRTRVLITSA